MSNNHLNDVAGFVPTEYTSNTVVSPTESVAFSDSVNLERVYDIPFGVYQQVQNSFTQQRWYGVDQQHHPQQLQQSQHPHNVVDQSVAYNGIAPVDSQYNHGTTNVPTWTHPSTIINHTQSWPHQQQQFQHTGSHHQPPPPQLQHHQARELQVQVRAPYVSRQNSISSTANISSATTIPDENEYYGQSSTSSPTFNQITAPPNAMMIAIPSASNLPTSAEMSPASMQFSNPHIPHAQHSTSSQASVGHSPQPPPTLETSSNGNTTNGLRHATLSTGPPSASSPASTPTTAFSTGNQPQQPPTKRKRGRPRIIRPEPPEDGSSNNSGTSKPKSSKVSRRQPHNQVERKYREGLNAEMERLRRALPRLPQTTIGEDGKDSGNTSAQNAQKPSKAVVLQGAVEEIARLTAEKEQAERERDEERINRERLEKERDKWKRQAEEYQKRTGVEMVQA